jgi:hypothetical protein
MKNIPKEEICSFCDGTGQVVSSTTISRFKTCDCKIIPKQETTLEEGFDRIYKELDYREFDFGSFKIGVEWQQERSYSEEEVLAILVKAIREVKTKRLTFFDGGSEYPIYSNLIKWFEQFKKK